MMFGSAFQIHSAYGKKAVVGTQDQKTDHGLHIETHSLFSPGCAMIHNTS